MGPFSWWRRRRRRARLLGRRPWKPWQLWLLGLLAALATGFVINRIVEHFFRYQPPSYYEPKDIERGELERRQSR